MAERTEDRYYWLKLHRDFFKNHKIAIIEGMENGKDYILFYLKLLCESIDHEGRLRFSDKIPYNECMLASLTKTNIDIVRSAIKVFIETELMEILDDGTMYMTEVQNLIGSQANNAHANRQRRYIENKRTTQRLLRDNESVTKNDAQVTDSVTNSDEEIRDKSKDNKNNITLSSSKDSESVCAPSDEASEKKKVDRVPYKQIVKLYEELCPKMNAVRPIVQFTDDIKGKVKARWEEYKGDIEVFRTVFTKAEASDFLNNRSDVQFQATFDWLMGKKNFSKAINGNFDNLKKRETIKGTDIQMSLSADGSDRSKYVETGWGV